MKLPSLAATAIFVLQAGPFPLLAKGYPSASKAFDKQSSALRQAQARGDTHGKPHPGRRDEFATRKVSAIEFLGLVSFPTGTVFKETQVGGLSGITYDAKRDVYYAISDDSSQINPARF